ncbi:MAG: T9SS type A sorting domain-containing protein [Candidatus Neomarinimicrobiota bacterium]
MKVNHHGSQYSTNQTFVDSLRPEVAIIEVGNGNSYKHPTHGVLDRLAAANCYIYQTELGTGGTIPSGKGVVANGHVIIKTSGTSYTVTYGHTTTTYPGDGPVSIKTEDGFVPGIFSLYQNYPNPFNPTTTISYRLPKSSFVKLAIYNIGGRLIETLVSEPENAGYHSVIWNGSAVPSGIYFYRIDAGKYSSTKKCLLIK